MKEFTVYGMMVIRHRFEMKITANNPLEAVSIARHDIEKYKTNHVEESVEVIVVAQPTPSANGDVRREG